MSETPAERTQCEVQEVAEVLLREKPAGTQLGDVWNEALSLHRVRYETTILRDEEH